MLFGISWDLSNNTLFAWSILPILWQGLIVTLQATIIGFLFASFFGLILSILKSSQNPWLSMPVKLISEFLRDTPLLIQVFFLYYVLPEYGLVFPAFLTGALAIGLQYSAYLSEVYRAGIESVSKGQIEAAKALDISKYRLFNIIILPQAIPRIIPALGNYLVSIMKDVPILSVVSILEILSVAKIIGDRSFNYIVPLSLVGLIYLIMTLISAWFIKRLEQKLPQEGIHLS